MNSEYCCSTIQILTTNRSIEIVKEITALTNSMAPAQYMFIECHE